MMMNDRYHTALRSNVTTFLPKFTKVRSNMSESKEEFNPVTAHSEILDCLEDSKKNFELSGEELGLARVQLL